MNPESFNLSIIEDLGTNIHNCAAVPPMAREQLDAVGAHEYFHYMLGMFAAQPGNEGPSTHLLDGTAPTNAETNIHFWRAVVDICGQLGLHQQKKGDTTYAYPRLRLIAPPLLIDRLSEFVRPRLPALAAHLQNALNPNTVSEETLERKKVEITGTDVQDLMGWLYSEAQLGLNHGVVGQIQQWRPRKVGMFRHMGLAKE